MEELLSDAPRGSGCAITALAAQINSLIHTVGS
jgi:hypothetical protein